MVLRLSTFINSMFCNSKLWIGTCIYVYFYQRIWSSRDRGLMANTARVKCRIGVNVFGKPEKWLCSKTHRETGNKPFEELHLQTRNAGLQESKIVPSHLVMQHLRNPFRVFCSLTKFLGYSSSVFFFLIL